MSQQRERRFLTTEAGRMTVEAPADSSPKIRGYAALFNTWSHPLPGPNGKPFRERILPGAFDAALAGEGLDVIANYEHSNRDILGRSTSGTLRLSVDERGLMFEIDPPDTTLGRDIRHLIERGDLGANNSGCSFAFTVSEDAEEIGRADDGMDTRTIRSVSGLYDIAICTVPAYPDTSLAVRSIEQARALETASEDQPPAVDAFAFARFIAKARSRFASATVDAARL